MKNSEYVVLARKYRPQEFDEVLGQPAVSLTLKNALSSKKLAHAYLFTGPRGVGKTTMARLLAKSLNCAKGPTPEPCGACGPCREIAASSSLDVLEMDAASHTGVDNVRQAILETVGLAPSRDRFKVFIIDEAHMLSTAAFNALLKTLEEPPGHVVFVLATTEAAKIPPTIASRCQRFKFRPIPVEILVERLKGIAKKEKIEVEPKALELLARSSEGSLRDATSLLDQCRAFGDGAVTEAQVREMFGHVPQEVLGGIVRSLLSKDAAGLGGWLRKVHEEGVEPAQLARDLRGALEAAYLDALGVEAAPEDWKSAAKGASPEALSFLLRRLNKVLEDLRFGDSPRLILELGLFGCLESAIDLKAWVERLERLEARLKAGGAAETSSKSPQDGSREEDPGAAPAAPAEERSVWSALVGQLRKEKPGLAAALEQGRAFGGASAWKIVFKRGFDLEQAQRHQELIEAKLATLQGRPIKLTLTLGEIGTSVTAEAVDPALDAPPEEGPEEGTPATGALRKAQEILGGKVKIVKKRP